MQRPPAAPPRSLGICHTFAGLALDRSRVVELKDQEAFQDAIKRPDSTFVLFHGTSALVKYPSSAAAGGAAPEIAYQTRQDLASRLAVSVEVGCGLISTHRRVQSLVLLLKIEPSNSQTRTVIGAAS